MKLCWFGCGILAVLLALSLLCGMLTQRSTRDAAAALELALDALDRDETAQAVEAGAQARQHWQRHRRFLCAVLSHDELDGIERGFAELRAYSAVGDAAELRSRCEVLLLHRAAGRAVCRELSHLPGADLGRLVIPRSEATWESLANDLEFAEVHRNFGPVLQNCTPRVLPRAAPPAGAMQ